MTIDKDTRAGDTVSLDGLSGYVANFVEREDGGITAIVWVEFDKDMNALPDI